MFRVFLTLILFAAPAISSAQAKDAAFIRDSAQLRCALLQMLARDQQYRSGKDLIWSAAKKEDSVNTLRMIGIINEYGYPSVHRFPNVAPGFLPHTILVHAPRVYADTLRLLLKAEREASRISPNEYAHIIWHLNGRAAGTGL